MIQVTYEDKMKSMFDGFRKAKWKYLIIIDDALIYKDIFKVVYLLHNKQD